MRGRVAMAALALPIAALAGCSSDRVVATEPAATERNPVRDWAAIVQSAIHNADEPRPPGNSEVLHAVVHLAVYDAAVAIEGGHQPYGPVVQAPDGADLNAAVATAAYRAARGRVAPSQFAYLDAEYAGYLADIPDGEAKTDGVEVGEAAASGILARRAGDRFDQAVSYQCSATPPPAGEFEPDGGCGTQPVSANLAQVRPFTFEDPAQFRPDGPDPATSARWIKDFDEVKEHGGKDSTVRTPDQTDVAYFWSEHAFVHWNRNLSSLAAARDLSVPETARLFAMVHTAAADAVIAGVEAKYFYRTWRPRTAVPRAAEDGNPQTAPDAAWTPLLSVNHPEYPSGHGFFTSALTEAVAAFFGTDDVPWTIETSKDAVPQLVRTQRTYENLQAVEDEVSDARVWAGLHYRNSMDEGSALGRRVAGHVLDGWFRPR